VIARLAGLRGQRWVAVELPDMVERAVVGDGERLVGRDLDVGNHPPVPVAFSGRANGVASIRMRRPEAEDAGEPK
jgi:hypothetical protein